MTQVAEIKWERCSSNDIPHALICGTLVAHNWHGFICLQLLEGDGSVGEATALSERIEEGVGKLVRSYRTGQAGHPQCSLSRPNPSHRYSHCVEVVDSELQNLIDQIEESSKND